MSIQVGRANGKGSTCVKALVVKAEIEKLRERSSEYEENADCIEVNDYGQKVYGDTHIEDAWLAGHREGFLEGLKAGKPKWHKVADGDLPNENNGEYLVYIDWLGRKIELLTAQEIKTYKNIIAWCEVPKFIEGETE